MLRSCYVLAYLLKPCRLWGNTWCAFIVSMCAFKVANFHIEVTSTEWIALVPFYDE